MEYLYPVTIIIRGNNVTTAIELTSIKKVDAITNQIDTLNFTLHDRYGVILPKEGEEVMMFLQAAPGAVPEKIYGGFIDKITLNEIYPGARIFDYDVSCVDYSKLATKKLVAEYYENMTAYNIIVAITEKYGKGLSVNHVEGSNITIAYVQFNYKTLFECYKDIAKATGLDWYIDYDKDLHFFVDTTSPAPYQLTEVLATTGHYKNLNITKDKSQLKNKIIIIGGKFSSDLFPEEDNGNGVKTSFKLTYKPFSFANVYVDIGSTGTWTEKTVGIDGYDNGFDFVVNYNEGQVKNQNHATLAATDKIKFVYKAELKIYTEEYDQTSIDQIIAIEGGDGIYEYMHNDASIKSLYDAHVKAQRLLAEYAYSKITGSFETDQSGYRSGQLLTVNMPTWGYVDTYLIQKVTSQFRKDNKFWYQIQFSNVVNVTLTEYLSGTQQAVSQLMSSEVSQELISQEILGIPSENI